MYMFCLTFAAVLLNNISRLDCVLFQVQPCVYKADSLLCSIIATRFVAFLATGFCSIYVTSVVVYLLHWLLLFC